MEPVNSSKNKLNSKLSVHLGIAIVCLCVFFWLVPWHYSWTNQHQKLVNSVFWLLKIFCYCVFRNKFSVFIKINGIQINSKLVKMIFAKHTLKEIWGHFDVRSGRYSSRLKFSIKKAFNWERRKWYNKFYLSNYFQFSMEWIKGPFLSHTWSKNTYLSVLVF